MSRRVCIVAEDCIACGLCQDICPEVFRLDDDEMAAQVIKPQGGPEDLVQEAIDSCPVSCIHWEE